MPKATVHKDSQAMFRKNEIRLAERPRVSSPSSQAIELHD
jgi:hypothetical protein